MSCYVSMRRPTADCDTGHCGEAVPLASVPSTLFSGPASRQMRSNSISSISSSTRCTPSPVSSSPDDPAFWSMFSYGGEGTFPVPPERPLFPSSSSADCTQLSSCRPGVHSAPVAQPPLFECCDPLKWDYPTVVRWLSEKVFCSDNARRSDLDFYRRNFVEVQGERLNGIQMGEMPFASFFMRWGYSAPVVFESFLHQLQVFGHAQEADHSLMDVWRMIQSTRPIESHKVGKDRRVRQLAFQPKLNPVHEQSGESSVERDGPMSIGSTSSGYDGGNEIECQKASEGAFPAPLSNASASTASQHSDESMYVDTVMATAATILWSPETELHSNFVTMTPASQLQEVQGVSDSDYESIVSTSSPEFGPPASPTNEATSPWSISPVSPDGSVSLPGAASPAEHNAATTTKRRHRKPRQRTPMPPSLTFPEASCGINLWEYLLELLADTKMYGKIITWKDQAKGIFCLLDSEVVAMLWGLHRNKKTMNYDKMSRAIRYYYNKLVDKVAGSRLTYKFLPITNWSTYAAKAQGYNDQYAGNRSMVCHGRLSRRKPLGAAIAPCEGTR